MSSDQPLYFLSYFIALATQGRELLSQAWQDDASRLRPEHDYGLLAQRLHDLCGPALSHARGEFGEPISQLLLAGRRQLNGRKRSISHRL